MFLVKTQSLITQFLVLMLLSFAATLGAANAKSLTFCSERAPEGFDPALFTTSATYDASSKPIYNRLVEIKRGTTEVEPGLAQSWEISEDGLEYRFNLRRDVTFHTSSTFVPTRTFNAEDVLFTFERQVDSGHPWHDYIAGTSWVYFQVMGMSDIIQSIEQIDDHTVLFRLNQPYAPFLANLAMDFASILSAEYADKLAKAETKDFLNSKPIGTGPFSFVEEEQGKSIHFASHSGYWSNPPAIHDLYFLISTDASTRVHNLMQDKCQVAAYPNLVDLPKLRQNDSLVVLEQAELNIGFLAYNTRIAPFDNVRIRRALNKAINKEKIIAEVFGGAGIAAHSTLPPTMWSHLSNDMDGFDLAAAKKELQAEGISGLEMDIWAMPVQRPYNPNAQRMAEIIQADFAQVGIDVRIVTHGWAEYLQRSRALDREGAVLLGWIGDNGDPNNFLGTLLTCDGVGGTNRTQWCNEEFDALIAAAMQTSDISERTALYHKAQTLLQREAPWATIAHSKLYLPMSKKIKGFVIDPMGGHWFDNVDIE